MQRARALHGKPRERGIARHGTLQARGECAVVAAADDERAARGIGVGCDELPRGRQLIARGASRRTDGQRRARRGAEAAARAAVDDDVGAQRIDVGVRARHHLDRVVGTVVQALLAALAAIGIVDRRRRPVGVSWP